MASSLGRLAKYGLSILVLAHTPKRSLSLPITQNDLAGSKKLFNFMDSAFAIGKTALDTEQRYLKQLKIRSGANEYDGHQVLTGYLRKADDFIKFEWNFDNETDERSLLVQVEGKTGGRQGTEERKARAKAMKEDGYTEREIAKELRISNVAVHKYLTN